MVDVNNVTRNVQSVSQPVARCRVLRSPACIGQDGRPGTKDRLFAGVVRRDDGSTVPHAELDVWGVTLIADENGSFEILIVGARVDDVDMTITVRGDRCHSRTEIVPPTATTLADGTLLVMHSIELVRESSLQALGVN
ncbi:MAG: hypothetical protein ACSLFD_00030 [Solirubrobacterales bacterium]